MPPILRNALVLIAALFVGGSVNMLLVNIGPSVFPPPEGADITSMEGLKATIHLFKPQNFIFPFLGHALGTLVAAFLTAKFATSHHRRLAIAVGFFFLLGGIMMAMQLPGPTWFNALDLLVAYIPMAWLGGSLAGTNY